MLTIGLLLAFIGLGAGFLIGHNGVPTADPDQTRLIKLVTKTLGRAPAHPSDMVAVVKKICGDDKKTLATFATQILDNNATDNAVTARLGIALYCPQRSSEFELDLAPR